MISSQRRGEPVRDLGLCHRLRACPEGRALEGADKEVYIDSVIKAT